MQAVAHSFEAQNDILSSGLEACVYETKQNIDSGIAGRSFGNRRGVGTAGTGERKKRETAEAGRTGEAAPATTTSAAGAAKAATTT
jgi:hypothetical protein